MMEAAASVSITISTSKLLILAVKGEDGWLRLDALLGLDLHMVQGLSLPLSEVAQLV